MKKLLIVLAVAGIAAFQGYKVLDRKADERSARERVSLMLERMKN